MKKKNKKTSLVILAAGISIVSFSQVIWHFVKLPDYINGALVGIGILIFALLKWRLKAASYYLSDSN